MAQQPKPAWYGVAAVALGSGVFFLAANKGRLFKKGAASLKAVWSRALAPTPGSPTAEDQTP